MGSDDLIYIVHWILINVIKIVSSEEIGWQKYLQTFWWQTGNLGFTGTDKWFCNKKKQTCTKKQNKNNKSISPNHAGLNSK